MKWLEEYFGVKYTSINDMLFNLGSNLLIAIVIVIGGFWLSNVIARMISKIMSNSKTDAGLTTFITSVTSLILKILVVVSAIAKLGVEMTSFVAMLGAVGLAIGMAFSGTLSNFAGGVMILVLKPFKVGDMILSQGEQGVVTEIQIFNTYLCTLDNKIIVLPNGQVANGNIINFTMADKRRVDWIFSISYGDDFQKAKKTLERFVKEESRIVDDPEYFIGIKNMGPSSVDITLQAWVKTDDFLPVFFDINERVYQEFGKEGLRFPFPQLDVHLKDKKG
jgi:small conductance mechanosensitive channel